MPVDPELDGPAYDAIVTHGAPAALLPAMDCVDALIAAEGNQRLAAEKLGVTVQMLVASIAQDPSAQASLNAQLRTLTTLMSFDSMRAAKAVMDEMICELEPKDYVKFYALITQQVIALTDDHTSTQNVNITEVVLKMLPPEARTALLELVGRGAPLTGPDGGAAEAA